MRKNAGITLITLVITILIIIILAGITINATLGDNGLIHQAQLEKDSVEGTIESESSKMNSLLQEYANLMAEDAEGGIQEPEEDTTPPTVTIIEGEITENSIGISVNANDPESGLASTNAYVYYLNGVEQTRSNSSSYTFSGLTAETQYTIKVEVYNGVGVKGEDSITVSTTSKTVENSKGEKFDNTTQIEDESGDTVWIPGGFEIAEDSANDADDGVVIQDSNGNQFVWIPVKDESKFQRYDGYSNGSKETDVSSGNTTEPFAKGYSTEKSEYDAMVSSVKNYDGFYVGRYEAGTTNANRSSSSGISDAVVVKKDAYVYNYVKWGNSMSDANGGAVQLSKGFASVNGYTTVTSTLIYGIQWDAVMNFIDPAYSTGSCSATSFVRDSSGKGWYNQSSPTKTGYYAVKNIYDLAGNVREWTMEAILTNHRVIRGGDCHDLGSSGPASLRLSGSPSFADVLVGFRLALYL